MKGYHTHVVHPGIYIADELKERDWTQKKLAGIMGRPCAVINQIVNEKKRITARTAIELAEAFGTSAEIWMNLQSDYDLAKERLER